MPRIQPINHDDASPEARKLLEQVQASMGAVPNLIATMAHSPAVANAYLGMSQALSKGKLNSKLREQIALAVGEANSCQYCVSAHSMLGSKAGLSEAEVTAARRGTAPDPASAKALAFARQLVVDRGNVTDDDLDTLRKAGFCDGAINEIVAHVAMNLFTNYFNHVAGTEIDFPIAEPLTA